MRTGVIALLLFAAVTAALAQPVTLGTMTNNAFGYFPSDTPVTFIDLSHPATGTATISAIVLRWYPGDTTKTCASGGYKVKFLRPSPSLATYTTLAERGPYPAPNGDAYLSQEFTPIVIQRGDLIAITQLGPTVSCGGAAFAGGDGSLAYEYFGDLPPSGNLSGNGQFRVAGPLLARASARLNVFDGVIAAAGSVAGSNGSFFRTALQLTNPDNVRLTGRLTFHPQGTPASLDDPSIAYSVEPHGTSSYHDILAALGAQGLGSLDLTAFASAAPTVTLRIFNDAGAAGTAGFTEPLLPPAAALQQFESGALAEPQDLTNYRMNVGVRTLEKGAQIIVQQFDLNGVKVGPDVVKDYPANYFEQVGLQQFTGAAPVAAGTLRVRVSAGSIILYASTTDNRTNDSSVAFMTRP